MIFYKIKHQFLNVFIFHYFNYQQDYENQAIRPQYDCFLFISSGKSSSWSGTKYKYESTQASKDFRRPCIQSKWHV